MGLRFEELIKVWTNAEKLNLPTVIIGDLNIDRLMINDPIRRHDLRNLIPKLEDFQHTFNFSLINNKPTRYRAGQTPSLLDLIMSNRPDLISSWENFTNLCSEHFGVICTIKSKPESINPQFFKTRNHRNLTAGNLMIKIESNRNLTEIFSETSPNRIAETLIKEMNTIIEEISPERKIQITRKNRLNLSHRLIEDMKSADDQVTVATSTLQQDDFRKAIRMQNKIKKDIEKERALL